MNMMKQLVMWTIIFSLLGFMSSCAAIQPEDRIRATVRDNIFAKPGDTVHLFYGMSKTATEEFCPDAVVPVFRPSQEGPGAGYYVSKVEVGKIKVIKNLGDHFIEAVVVNGELRLGDIAMQANSECMIKMP